MPHEKSAPQRAADSGPGRRRQTRIYVEGAGGKRPTVPTDPERLAATAREVMSEAAWAYVAGGAGSGATMHANRSAFERWRLLPRVLRDASVRDLSTRLFGRQLPVPLLLAPIGVLELAHPEADLAVARAASALGVPMIFSNQASVPMEVCAGVMGDAPRWFQLYWSADDALVESFVARAEACGCEAIVLTLDTTVLGWRPRDLDLAYLPFLRGMGIAQYTSDAVFRASLETPLPPPEVAPPLGFETLRTAWAQLASFPGSWPQKRRYARAAVQRFVATYSRPSLAWPDLAFLRARTRLPILLKGILDPADALRAIDAGCDGVIVSNHGGRQVDGAVGALAALPLVVEKVGGRIPVLMDSGIRGGADVLKALALGADAVLLGRPYVYGLAIAGEAGVREVIENIIAETDLSLGLLGRRSLAELGPDCLVQDDRNHADFKF